MIREITFPYRRSTKTYPIDQKRDEKLDRHGWLEKQIRQLTTQYTQQTHANDHQKALNVAMLLLSDIGSTERSISSHTCTATTTPPITTNPS